MKMDVQKLTVVNLIKKTKAELVKTSFSKLTLKGIERVWNNLEQYLRNQGVNYFSMDHAIGFLNERYHFTETGRPALMNQRRLRAIQYFQSSKDIYPKKTKNLQVRATF
jgi:hypothetical protein